MDTNARIRALLDENGWTEYRLAKQAGLSQSTIINIFRRNTVPSIATLENICNAFGISLSQFFAEDSPPSQPEHELLRLWRRISEEQREAILHTMKTML